MFNINVNTFPNDTVLNANFNNASFNSMKWMNNLSSQLFIVIVVIYLMAIFLIVKNIVFRFCKR